MASVVLLPDLRHQRHQYRYETIALILAIFSANLFPGLLAFRIWRINQNVNRSRMRIMKNKLLPIMNICLDSGFLYTATLTIAIVLFGIHSPETFSVQDPVSCIFQGLPSLHLLFLSARTCHCHYVLHGHHPYQHCRVCFLHCVFDYGTSSRTAARQR
jgi:hypothetical protein